MFSSPSYFWKSAFVLGLVLILPRTGLADPWADHVVGYSPGTNPQAGYTPDPTVTLGSPERFSGELTPYPGDVTIFSSAFGTDEIISVGAGGSLTVRFDDPVVDAPSHLYGVDLVVFGNAFFTPDFGNPDYPITGINNEPATVEVSADGLSWFTLSGTADGLFPTQGYLDSGEFGFPPGSAPTDFLKPVNPALGMSDFLGLTYAQALALYDRSGGGTPFDISATGLSSISYVRVSVPEGANWSAEIDAFANVPEPSVGALILIGATLLGARRTRSAQLC